MTSEKYYAHTTPDGRLQTIEEHAKGTAERAKEYASAFGFGDAAYAEGLFHDVGKYAPAFQARLRGAGEKYEHSSAGMRLFAERAAQRRSNADMLLAFAIAGHHTGLPDQGNKLDTEDGDTFMAKLKRRRALGDDFDAYRAELGDIPEVSELTGTAISSSAECCFHRSWTPIFLIPKHSCPAMTLCATGVSRSKS